MTDKAGHFVHTFHFVLTLILPFLQGTPANDCHATSSAAPMEVLLLPYLQLAEALSGQIQFDVRQLVQGDVAVLVLHQSDDDTEEDGVVAFLFTFKNEPSHATEREDGTANCVLSLPS